MLNVSRGEGEYCIKKLYAWVSIKTLKLHIDHTTVKLPDKISLKISLIIFLQALSKAWILLTVLTTIL